MNYELKRLQGQQDPQLLHVQYQFDWNYIQNLAQAGDYEAIIRNSKQSLARRLSDEILKVVPIRETPTAEGLTLRVRMYVHTVEQFTEILGKAYRLGQESIVRVPDFSQFRVSS